MDKKERNKRERERVKNNRANLLKDGIPLDLIISERLDRKSYKGFTKTQKSELRRRGLKLQALKKAGYTYKDVKGDLRKSVDDICLIYDLKEIPGIKNPNALYEGKTWGYIGFSDVDGFIIENLSNIPNRELKNLIKGCMSDAKNMPDDSDGFRGAFKVVLGTKEECYHAAEVYYSHGYNFSAKDLKLTGESFSVITITNKFTQRGFWEMMYTCISQMKNSDIIYFVADMRELCERNGWPFYRSLFR